MLELNTLNWVVAFLPLFILLVLLIGLKWSAPRAGTLAFIVATIGAWLFFGADSYLLTIASAKGLSLTLFVLLIIWSSVFMYNIIDSLGGIKVIGVYIGKLAGDSHVAQALLLGWTFSGFVQGITGFGVPVAVVVPLLLVLGFSPVISATLVLIGHSWAVTFGSLASSYYTIQLATGIDGAVMGPTMAALFALPIIATGFCLAHIEGGWQGVRNSALVILMVGSVVSWFVWLMAYIGAVQIASVVPGIIGCGVIWLLSKTSLLRRKSGGDAVPSSNIPGNGISFHLAFLPYYLIILLTIMFQLPYFNEIGNHLFLAFDYPGLETSLGYVVDPVKAYAKISLLNHPAPLILTAIFVTFLTFLSVGRWKKGAGLTAFKTTVRQCVPTSVGIATMAMMALIMVNTGMIDILAKGIARVTGAAFPIFSPYIGVLGSFMTGSNTNSNIMFGSLQTETAVSLGISPLLIACTQSIGGSLGSAIAPAKVLLGSSLAGLAGREGEVMRKALPYCLFVVLLVGLQALLAVYIFPH